MCFSSFLRRFSISALCWKVVVAPTAAVARGKSPASQTPEPATKSPEPATKTPSPSDPANADDLPPSSLKQQVEVREKKSEHKKGHARARYSFQAENVRELSLTKVRVMRVLACHVFFSTGLAMV